MKLTVTGHPGPKVFRMCDMAPGQFAVTADGHVVFSTYRCAKDSGLDEACFVALNNFASTYSRGCCIPVTPLPAGTTFVIN